MPKARYQTKEYLAAYQKYKKLHKSEILQCSEPRCLMLSRNIYPADKMDISHDVSGTSILGPSHAKCNRTEAAIRGRAKQLGRDQETIWDLDNPARHSKDGLGYWRL